MRHHRIVRSSKTRKATAPIETPTLNPLRSVTLRSGAAVDVPDAVTVSVAVIASLGVIMEDEEAERFLGVKDALAERIAREEACGEFVGD